MFCPHLWYDAPVVDSDPVAARLSLIRPYLDERAWRLLLGAEAKVLGRGAIKLVARAGGVHPDTVARGVRELDCYEAMPGRVRRPGAGRPQMAVTDPDLVAALDALVDPLSRGDPESPLRWTTKSTAKLAAELTRHGASGVRAHGGQAAQTGWLQPAGELENH